MKNKKLLSILLAAAMLLGLTACGKGGETETDGDGEYDQVVYAYATFNNIPSEEALDDVEEAINKITRETINAEITLMPINLFEYSSKVSLELQGGGKIDCFQAVGDFNNALSSDMAYDITELAQEYAKETVELMGEEWLAACTAEGSLYGFPTYKPIALTPMVIYRQDIADELEIDMSQVETLEDVTAVLEKVRDVYPDMTALAPVATGDVGLSRMVSECDWLTDSYDKSVGVLLGDDLTVVDLYSTDEFRSLCETARYWYENNLVMKDAATTTSAAAELMASGNYFCYIASYSYPEADTAASLEAQCGGYALGAKIIEEAYLKTDDINGLTWMVSSTTDVPEAAIKFLNLTFTDGEIVNLLIYGIEGRDYVRDENGLVSYPEGEDASTVPYTAQLSCGTLGNYFNMYCLVGTDPASLEWELEQNQSAKTSPAMGFTFDSSSVKTQYTAVYNVLEQYLPGLLCGSLDPDTEIANFAEALNNAGYQDILNEKQTQLDAWAEAN